MESSANRIVIVEDEGLIAADLQVRLERAGYQVPGIAASGGEALQVIRAQSPDLVLMDIRLAGDLDGIQVADKVRQEFDIPIVYLTAFEDRETLQRASATQAFGYIKKPIASASLQGSIEMAISKHRHERYLREQRDWLTASFSAVPDAVLVTDGAGRICYLNRTAEELTGCKVDAALGRRSAELLRFSYSDGRPVEDLAPVVMLQAEPVSLPSGIWLERGPDRRIGIEGSLAPRLQNGRMEGAVISFKDVTAARFESEQARQDAKHAALARLADGVACQLDFELSVVADETTNLLNSLPEQSTMRCSAEAIEHAALEAFAVTCRLRSFGQKEIEPRIVRVNEILSRLEGTWRPVLPGLSLRLDADPRPVHADSHELTKTLDLILDHANRSMNTNCGVVITAASPEIDALRDWVRIRIAYTTIGEDASALERVFDPSWDGNWEGLPFAYGSIKRMGGLISAGIEPNKRVSFEIYLPSIKASAAGATLEHFEEPVVLLVDANAEVRRVLHSHFEQHGFKVLETGDCREALSLAETYQGPFRLVLANQSKEELSTTDFVRKLLARDAGVCVRVLEGYREQAGDGSRWAPSRCLTKWDLLEWANQALGSRAWALAAN